MPQWHSKAVTCHFIQNSCRCGAKAAEFHDEYERTADYQGAQQRQEKLSALPTSATAELFAIMPQSCHQQGTSALRRTKQP